ncbi:MAG: protein kinase, partial [Gemmatimonadales bacterium]|nr:protein kinase [Gemmatimonadales bacterium]
AGALDYAHRQHVVHRDIKPENILLQEGQAIVADFGIARALDPGAADPGRTAIPALGTPAYMSPEQATRPEGIDGRTDVYALGCVLYEMVGGCATIYRCHRAGHSGATCGGARAVAPWGATRSSPGARAGGDTRPPESACRSFCDRRGARRCDRRGGRREGDAPPPANNRGGDSRGAWRGRGTPHPRGARQDRRAGCHAGGDRAVPGRRGRPFARVSARRDGGPAGRQARDGGRGTPGEPAFHPERLASAHRRRWAGDRLGRPAPTRPAARCGPPDRRQCRRHARRSHPLGIAAPVARRSDGGHRQRRRIGR